MKNHILVLLFFSFLMVCACASLQQPQGGPRDREAPKILNEVPKNLTRNFKGKTIAITFDEYFKLTNEFSEISISPSLEIPPTFKIKQKTLEINFKDSLETNTTYTINFGKAIQDVNEANVLKNYSYVFSTGPKLDSLQISGKVISADDNKPVKDVTVLLFPLNKDTLFTKKKPSIYTSTDSAGLFRLKNLREDTYTIYGLKESSGDRIYNSYNEEISFLANPIKLNKDTTGILLKLFKEIPDKFRIVDRKIDNDGKLLIIANKPINNPSITFLEHPEGETNAIIEFSAKGDTTQIWYPNLTFDSLKIAINEDKKALDTLTFKRSKKDTYTRNVLFSNNLSGGKIKPSSNLVLTFNTPIKNIDINKIILLEDSTTKKGLSITKLQNSNRKYQINYPWLLKKRYKIGFDKDAIEDIYGGLNKPLSVDVELDEIENYGTLSLNISRTDSTKHYLIELITDKNNLYQSSPINANTTLVYKNLPTGKYLVKVIEDENKNGVYDTGNVKLKLQAEKAWFYEKEIINRANWEREEKIVIPKDF